MNSASLARVLYGSDEATPAASTLRAGPLEMTLEHGKLWCLRLGDVEVWHGLGFVYRDVDWGTPDAVIERTDVDIKAEAFRILCRGHFPCRAARLPFTVLIEGGSDGYVRFKAEATPPVDIETNRTGLCLLHPMKVGGARVAIEHVDGRESQSTFPTLVPPWPPFMLIRAVRHEYAPDLWARCEFEGDCFELEDQRNNSDASFKTYNRSNLMPRPYWLRAGVVLRQSALLWVERPSSVRRRPPAGTVTVGVHEAQRTLPQVGTEIAASDARLSREASAALQALRPSHLHLSVNAAEAPPDWKGIAALRAAADAQLRLDVVLGDVAAAPRALDALRTALDQVGIAPESLAIFPSEQPCLDAARERFPAARIGGGTHQFFVQLHRAERIGAVDFATFTTSPIVHGTRDSEVMLTLQSLPSLVETLRPRFPMAIHVGPSTIGARSSPLGKQPSSDGTQRVTLARRDPRCRGLFGAAWVLGYVAQCAKAGVEAISLMSLTGDSAMLDEMKAGPPLLHPTYFVLSRLGGSPPMRELSVSDPTRVAGVALCRDKRLELLVANLTAESLDVDLQGLPASAGVAILHADSLQSFRKAADPWEANRQSKRSSRHALPPYAVMSCVVRS